MRLVMTLLARDESDIIAANLDFHYSQGVDHVIATDNRSVDATSEILRGYEKQGRLTLLHESGDNHAQGKWVTRMARLAVSRFGAEWVINNDADEFWWPAAGDLKSTLAALPRAVGVLSVMRSNFVPAQDEGGSFFERMRMRHKVSRNYLGGLLPAKACHRGFADAVVPDGNHGVMTSEAADWIETRAIEILHFPMRSYRQFENKIRVGGAAIKRNTELAPGVGDTWRHMHDELLAGRLEQFYRAQVLDSATLRKGARDGSLIEDHRLARHLAKLNGSAVHG
jgi:hypothetical protein